MRRGRGLLVGVRRLGDGGVLMLRLWRGEGWSIVWGMGGRWRRGSGFELSLTDGLVGPSASTSSSCFFSWQRE